MAKIKPNQSLHVTIKEPPNPEPISTLGIFTALPNDALRTVLDIFLSEVTDAKAVDFTENVKDEVRKALQAGKVLAVSRLNGILTVYIQEP